MINIGEVKETNEMIEKENLDVRTITLGISLLDCIDSDLDKLNQNIYNKITTLGEYWTGEYNLSRHPLWKGKITAIRFDPFNSPGMMNIDYIKLQG